MVPIKLYPFFEPAFFVERENRFVLLLKKTDGSVIKAYIANPGRMEEFLVPNHPFFITRVSGDYHEYHEYHGSHGKPRKPGKYFYHVVSTFYQDSFVLLDTIKINFLVELMLKYDLIDAFLGPKSLRREVSVNRSKFDFLVERENKKPVLLEVKSCSLCHHGVAMFPDAPTSRGKRHMEDLIALAAQGYDTYTLYWINHNHAQVFRPNGHTDRDYCLAFCKAKPVNFLAYRSHMLDPVTLDLSLVKPVPIDFDSAPSLCASIGSYLLVFFNPHTFEKTIGSLGVRVFKKGYYVYAGSALQGLDKRINRHLRKNKKIRWHLDYISPQHMKIEKVYPVRRPDRIEVYLARGLLAICEDYVKGFGASDSGLPSHFFYFSERPYRRRDFLDLLLNFRMSINYAFGDQGLFLKKPPPVREPSAKTFDNSNNNLY